MHPNSQAHTLNCYTIHQRENEMVTTQTKNITPVILLQEYNIRNVKDNNKILSSFSDWKIFTKWLAVL
jgi:hypothetical protein